MCFKSSYASSSVILSLHLRPVLSKSYQSSDIEYNHEADDLIDQAQGEENYDHGEEEDEFDENVEHVSISDGQAKIANESVSLSLDTKTRTWTGNIWSSKKIL